MRASIIIPTCKSENFNKCLESIKKYTDLTTVEIVVVPNGYDGNWKDFEGCKVVGFSERIGFTRATNEGIRISTGDYVILLNDDTILLEQGIDDWINILTSPFEDSTVGITGPLMSWCPHSERNFLIFFCVAIRRELFNEIGLLDEVFSPGGGEDTDFCIKAENAGYKLVQVPGSPLTYMAENPTNKIYAYKFMVGGFPIYHKAESTFGEDTKWQSIFDRNSKKLESRYKLPPGWFYPDDIKTYRKLINEIDDYSIITELGCWKGRSLCSIADLIIKKNLKVIAVDTFKGSPTEEAHAEAKINNIREEFENNLKRFEIFDKVKIYEMTTEEASEIVVDSSLVFIDAGHTYEDVSQDIRSWRNKTEILSGHDYSDGWRGVKDAVNDILGEPYVGGTVWYKYL